MTSNWLLVINIKSQLAGTGILDLSDLPDNYHMEKWSYVYNTVQGMVKQLNKCIIPDRSLKPIPWIF